MNKQNNIIRVRPIFRILGIMLCAAGLFVFYDLLSNQNETSRVEIITYIINFFLIFPLIFISCILGRIPFFITRNLSKDILDDLEKTENLFFEFSFKTTVFFIVSLTIAFFFIYIYTFA
jgi:cytochrome bd-type quinol oxidase subunit 1